MAGTGVKHQLNQERPSPEILVEANRAKQISRSVMIGARQ